MVDNRIDLRDCTALIPFFYDSVDRVENLNFLIDYLNHHLQINIIIKEVGHIPTLAGLPWIEQSNIVYKYEASDDPIFHRTKVLNELCKMAKTDIVVNQDTDVVCPPIVYKEARDAIKNGYDVIYPYNGRFMECSRSRLKNLRQNYDFDCIKESELNCLNPNSVGGIIFQRKDKFKEDERIYGWAFDDDIRMQIFKMMGYKIGRTKNYLIHVEHFRGKNSGPENPYYQNNLHEYRKIMNMNRFELEKYISTWN